MESPCVKLRSYWQVKTTIGFGSPNKASLSAVLRKQTLRLRVKRGVAERTIARASKPSSIVEICREWGRNPRHVFLRLTVMMPMAHPSVQMRLRPAVLDSP